MAPRIASSTVSEASRPEERSLQDELSDPILLADRVIKSAQEAESARQECADLVKQVERLSHMLRTCVRLSSGAVYERPVRRVAGDIYKNLERALSLVRKCRRSRGSILRHVFSMTSTADFRKVANLLESSIGDMRWLLSILDGDGDEDGGGGGGANLALPPIASNDPILAWVWSYISTIHKARQLKDRADAANELAFLACDNDRNKKIIVEEGGVLPLLKLLKESASPDAQVAGANALLHIATNQERVRLIVDVLGVPIVVGALGGDSSMRVQISAASLLARMAEMDDVAQEELVRANVTKPLVSLLSTDLALDFRKTQPGNKSIHSIVINKELVGASSANDSKYNYRRGSSSLSNHSSFSDGSSRGGKKEREQESPEIRLKLQISCAEALWKLVRGSLSASKKITETKGLLCLAKIAEKERGDLRYNCLMAIMEITVVAEKNADLRRAAFKTNSPAAKLVLDQLLRVIQEEDDPTLQIASIRAIGCLARTFPARETRIIGPLVSQLGNRNLDVATEACIALGKFVCTENFNREEHSKAVIEFDGIPPLMRLIRAGDVSQMNGLVLLCYLALNAGNSKALEQARALNALEGAARSVVAQYPDLKELFTKAIHHLALYQAGAHPHRQSSA